MSDAIERPTPTISVGTPSDADLKELMSGTNGNPTYEEQFGMTSAPLGTTGIRQPTLAELEFQAKLDEARALNPNAFAASQQFPTQVVEDASGEPNYKQLYGQSENEKGALRKSQQELMDAFNGLMAQYEALQSAQGQPQWGGQQMASQQQYVGPQQFGPYAPQQFVGDPFEGINDDDVVQGKQVKGLVERAIAPVVAQAWQAAQQASQRTAQLEQQIMRQAQAQSGITKLDEFRLVAKNPWLNGMPPQQRMAALSSLKQAEVAGAPAAIQTSAADTQQRIVNKVTYIEGSKPQTADNSQAALEAAKSRDYALAMAQEADTGARARALRAFANKYGLNFGQNPSDLAR